MITSDIYPTKPTICFIGLHSFFFSYHFIGGVHSSTLSLVLQRWREDDGFVDQEWNSQEIIKVETRARSLFLHSQFSSRLKIREESLGQSNPSQYTQRRRRIKRHRSRWTRLGRSDGTPDMVENTQSNVWASLHQSTAKKKRDGCPLTDGMFF